MDFKTIFDKTAATAKKLAEKAGETAEKLGDIASIKMQISSCESKIKTLKLMFGDFVYETFASDANSSLSCNDEKVNEFMKEFKYWYDAKKKWENDLLEAKA